MSHRTEYVTITVADIKNTLGEPEKSGASWTLPEPTEIKASWTLPESEEDMKSPEITFTEKGRGNFGGMWKTVEEDGSNPVSTWGTKERVPDAAATEMERVRGITRLLATIEEEDFKLTAAGDTVERLQEATSKGIPVPLKMWGFASGVDLEAVLSEVSREGLYSMGAKVCQSAEVDPLGGWVKDFQTSVTKEKLKALGISPKILEDDGFASTQVRGVTIGAGLSLDAGGSVSVNSPDDVANTGFITNHLVQPTVALPQNSASTGLSITFNPDGVAGMYCTTLKCLDDHVLDDLVADSVGGGKTITRLVRVNMEDAYWKAFKGIASVLDGRHLRFQETGATIVAQGYNGGECMLLDSDVTIPTWTIHEGARERSLKGLVVPKVFLI